MPKTEATAIRPYKNYKWIVWAPDLLGGKPTVRGTRISVALVLECLAAGMSSKEIAEEYEGFPQDCVSEVLTFAAAQASRPVGPDDVAA